MSKVGGTSGINDYIDIHKISFDHKCQDNAGSSMRFTIEEPGGGYSEQWFNETTWTHHEYTYPTPKRHVDGTGWALQFIPEGIWGNWHYIDNVYIDFTYTDV